MNIPNMAEKINIAWQKTKDFLPKELEGIRNPDTLIKMYCDLRREYVDILKENSTLKQKNKKLKKENKEISHELWIKDGCGYMGGS